MFETALPIADGLIAGSTVLLAGTAFSVFFRQPVHRLRVFEITMLSAFAALLLATLPFIPRWSLTEVSTAFDDSSRTGQTSHESTDRPSSGLADAPQRATGPHFAPSLEAAGSEAGTETPGPRVVQNSARANTAVKSEAWSRAFLEDMLSQFGLSAELATVLAVRLLIALWLIGVALILSWLTIGVVLLAQIVRQAREAGEPVPRLLSELTGRPDDAIRAVASHRTLQPVACRIGGRVIVLPEPFLLNASERQLRFALAHEWSHIDRGDWWSWLLANLTRAVFFFNPGAWWIRRQVRLCQDYIADARAAGEGQARIDYAEFLTEQASISRQPVLGIAMGMRGRRSELFNRVLLLVRGTEPLVTDCPRNCTRLLAAGGLLLAALCGSGEIIAARHGALANHEAAAGQSELAGTGFSASHVSGSRSSVIEMARDAGSSSLESGTAADRKRDASPCIQLTAVGRVEGTQIHWFKQDGSPVSPDRVLPSGVVADRILLDQPEPGRPTHAFLVHCWKQQPTQLAWELPGAESCLLHEEEIELGDRRLSTVIIGTHWQSDESNSTHAAIRLGYRRQSERSKPGNATAGLLNVTDSIRWLTEVPITFAMSQKSVQATDPAKRIWQGKSYVDWLVDSKSELDQRGTLQVLAGLRHTAESQNATAVMDRVLDLTANLDFESIDHGDSFAGQLKMSVLELIQQLPTPVVLSALRRRIADDPGPARALTGLYLQETSSEMSNPSRLRVEALRVAPGLLRGLSEDSPRTRARIISTLLAIIPNHPDVVVSAREFAACESGRPLFVILEASLESEPTAPWIIDRLLELSYSEELNEQVQSERLLSRAMSVGTAPQPVIEHFAELLSQPERRSRALQLLIEAGPKAGPAVDTLVRDFERDAFGDRDRILDVLAAIGPAADSAVPVLEQFIRRVYERTGFDAVSESRALTRKLRNETWGEPKSNDKLVALKCAETVRQIDRG